MKLTLLRPIDQTLLREFSLRSGEILVEPTHK